uniref:Ig-like domain-containing protein n=1 Tax=Oryzias latipes TaxID=8090 RepID=A0A3P9I2Y5_ORYLA
PANQFILKLFPPIFYSCADEGFETKTVDAGEDVTLLCNNLRLNVVFFFWMKSVPGKMPEIVGKRFSKSDEFNNTGHFTTKEEDGRFFLKISKAKPSDIAFYYYLFHLSYALFFICFSGPHSDLPAVVQSSVDPVTAGDVVALQCSVLSEFQNDACPEEHRVFWFRKTEGESHPTYIYARRSSDGDCDGGTETQPLQNCVYSFLKNVSSSDAGLYYCAVAACGKVVFGNGTELDVEGNSNHDSRSNNTFFFLFFGTLVFGLMMVTFLICVVSKESCAVCKGKRICRFCSCIL